MQNAFFNMEVLLGVEGVNKLGRARIAIFGIGSVGSYVAEALARCGVGCLTLIDYAKIDGTQINRQLHALQSTVGKSKVKAAKERIRDIDDEILVHTYETFYCEDTADLFDLKAYDYIVDTMGDIRTKLLLIEQAKKQSIPILSCMGTDNRMNPGKYEITDISRTRICRVAKVIRAELQKKGIRRVKVLFSRERPMKVQDGGMKEKENDFGMEGTVSYMPAIAGMMLAGEVVRDLLAEKRHLSRKKGLTSHKT